MMTTTDGSKSILARRIRLPTRLRDERGVALVLVILMAVGVAVLAMGSTMIAVNSGVIQTYHDRQSSLGAVADAGLELARSSINADPDLYPDSDYIVLEDDVQVTDVNGDSIPGVRRTTYVGPTGISTGQYGVFGSVVTVAEDDAGNRVVRRREVRQDSFSKYAYFTISEGDNIWFGGGDQLFGPVHSNDRIKIHTTGATFNGPVTTAEDVYQQQYGTFNQGYTEDYRYIELPEVAELEKLETQATAGGTAITGNFNGSYGQATTRIEFIALDLNGDGDSTDRNEGFMRVYRAKTASDAGWVVGSLPSDYFTNGLRNSENCGSYHKSGNKWYFTSADDHSSSQWLSKLKSSTRRCLLGGADSLWDGTFDNDDPWGYWVQWPGQKSSLLDGRADKNYLWPINRSLNPSFKGVVYVDGNVAISGTLRGRVTLAATGDIILADDLTYATDPGAGTCADILGLFAADEVIVAANTLNMPVQPSLTDNHLTYDDTKDEFFHMVILTLNVFTAHAYSWGSTNDEACEGTTWGRGCLYLTGGIIQHTRGAVGTTAGTGYLKRYSYDQCAFSDPPPYFPTTEHFDRGQYFEIDPNGFDIDDYWDRLTPN